MEKTELLHLNKIRARYADSGLSQDDYKQMTTAELARMRLDVKRLLLYIDQLDTPTEADNKALTVEELREAADCGNTVWLVGVGAKDQWVRVDYVESLTIGFSAFCDAETWSFCAERYGKTVFAYRRPPEKGD